MAHTPTPWAVEDTDGTNNHQHCKVYELVDSKGKTIADCHNSEVADIQCDPDEYGSNCWDEQGRQDFEFIMLACNSHDALVTALEGLLGAVKEPVEESMGFDHPPEYRNEEDHWLAHAIHVAREALKPIKGAQ